MAGEVGPKSMMNNRSKTSRNLYAVIPLMSHTLVICETMHHIFEAKIFVVIDHQLSKQTPFSYFAAVSSHGLIKTDLE